MADIFNEVEEELRKDKYQEWLRTYGPWVGGAAAALILAVAGYEGWKAWSTSQEQAASEEYSEAVDFYEANDMSAAAAELEDIAANGPDGYAALALMRRGAIALEEGDREAAAGFFEDAAARTSDPIIADLATLKAVWAQFEAYSPDDLANRLAPLTGQDRPYRFLAQEAIGISAMQAGDHDAARQAFEAIIYSVDAPQGAAARANAALAVTNQMDPEGAEDAAEAADPAGAVEDEAATESEFSLGLSQDGEGDAGDDSPFDDTMPELNMPREEPVNDGAQEDPNP
ncbi:tetratricopeptide repeat protein [Hyphobacterium marinum]|uniref:Ancillary SecYEG translocon subunit n=1 Tax=Hyphobacterium marinum TaxID=3116574 RepID=A0ABU7M0D8_9PROT|nr:tetratricopeptide repeat protein [Hyphobacterium sp. Y6023]MEE2567166.1 tetratricopeptide repeat protein [Hyphobacterium sp. Y6023]